MGLIPADRPKPDLVFHPGEVVLAASRAIAWEHFGQNSPPDCFVSQNAGGASRDRTGDLKLAKLALSQLSYGPIPNGPNGRTDHGSRGNGGPGKIRTSDLTLIRGAL